MDNKKKIILSVLVTLFLISVGIAYAFFTYENIGQKSEIVTGQIYMDYEETSTISLTNVWPETKAQALARQDKNGVFEFTITGRNTHDKPIYYEIDLLDGGVITGKTASSTKILPDDLMIYLERDGEVLVDGISFKDFNSRRIWVETIPANQTSNIEHKYTLRMWISEKVTISDTDPNASYTTSEWNDSYASLKVRVVGDFMEKYVPYNYMAKFGITDEENYIWTFWPDSIEAVKANITEVNFVQMDRTTINTRSEAAPIKEDVSDTTKGGLVKVWLENSEIVNDKNGNPVQQYTMYVASDGITYLPSDSSNMFFAFENLENITFENIDTSNVTDMDGMFGQCSSLTSLDVSSFDTSKVTDMSYMFEGCYNLTSLDVSGFDTNNVTDMSWMFYDCSSLTSLDLSNFDTSQVIDIGGMFEGCYNLTSLDLSNFDTSHVTTMEYMFCDCSSLTSLDLSNFDTSHVTTMECMFLECTSLTSLDVSSFDTRNVENMYSMFYNCSKLMTIYANTDWNTNNVSDSEDMFYGCTKLVGAVPYDSTKIDVTMANPTTGYFTYKTNGTAINVMADLSVITNKNSIYEVYFIDIPQVNIDDRCANVDECWNLTLDNQGSVTGWLEGNTLYIGSEGKTYLSTGHELFEGWGYVETIDFGNVDTSMVTDMSGMFAYCDSLNSLDLSNFNTYNVTNMAGMFNIYDSSLTSLDLSSFDTRNVTNMYMMFYNLDTVTTLDLSSFDTSNVTDMTYMFSSCRSLTTIYANTDWSKYKVEASSNMFYGCTKLVGAVPYDSTKIDVTMANPTTGYFTRKTA